MKRHLFIFSRIAKLFRRARVSRQLRRASAGLGLMLVPLLAGGEAANSPVGERIEARSASEQFDLVYQLSPDATSAGNRAGTDENKASLLNIISSPASKFDERLKAVYSLGENLNREEIGVLHAFLKSASAPEEKDLPALHGLKNDILNVLRSQIMPPAGFTDQLIEMYADTAQDIVLRDYAIQHLVAWYEQGAGEAPHSKDKIRRMLNQVARESNSIAGTALLGMHRLSADDSNFSKQEIDQLALAHALSADGSSATRITAIQVCAERRIKAVLPAIESLPQEAASLPLRLSAIAALGQLGGQQSKVQLQDIDVKHGEDFSAALRAALQRLEHKDQTEKIY